ncbi:hypothetical protein [Roseibium album]|uniref:hypothetical protein n=1 Tax=Roseibium album TaxID=311410 RepID=UPI003299999E
MAIVTYELRDAAGTAFAILKVDTAEKTWLDAKGDASILRESQGTARKSDGTLGIYCDSDNGNVVQLINADWSDGPPNNHEARCRRCDVGCESEPRWHCTARE